MEKKVKNWTKLLIDIHEILTFGLVYFQKAQKYTVVQCNQLIDRQTDIVSSAHATKIFEMIKMAQSDSWSSSRPVYVCSGPSLPVQCNRRRGGNSAWSRDFSSVACISQCDPNPCGFGTCALVEEKPKCTCADGWESNSQDTSTFRWTLHTHALLTTPDWDSFGNTKIALYFSRMIRQLNGMKYQ